MLQEITKMETEKWRETKSSMALYFYTPLCGTCKVGERMLEVVQATLPEVLLYKVNINQFAETAHGWKLESVPCLVILKEGRLVKKIYAMQSVSHLFQIIKENLL